MKHPLQNALFLLAFSMLFTTSLFAQYTPPEQAAQLLTPKEQIWLFEQGVDVSEYKWDDNLLNRG